MLKGKGRKTPNKMEDNFVEVTWKFLVCHSLHAVIMCFKRKKLWKGIINISAAMSVI